MVCVNLYILLIHVVICCVLLEFSANLEDMFKYKYRKAKFMHDNLKGYWVTLYFITNGVNTFTLHNQSDWIDNLLLIRESEYVQGFTRDILVSPTEFTHIFKEIEDYEKCACIQS